ncbi:hypothetical protein COCC4DRAFT_126638 [Bipolaris maydis ATCC 48331]|uniref:Aspergillopepsin-2 n=2 Tax=Cochliobolus heterostrophus TaxID=5016 RepID=M2U9U4_COCH5|nr:uncharacterized protein COCC4DRAFT_126638 [Bipolaris maydis ATCC 48331]EMD90511.1 hypothetical protein COCHEDRAFT_1106541 [Bipolaris maydis C5]KAH7555458.1 hypothetical protein BM1_07081 [Bipolaris maydis]ENI09276.1 hypothetical protein COCC4DRAFT_126638 [Bipolaris maydis ATCC 48331]KAJ5023672.1 peptidase A4 family-domain-containing protein [Bipolaris maydis]KAJ5058385.1 peptidase A4 family-domain-containing protein [Bipolaris maydis]
MKLSLTFVAIVSSSVLAEGVQARVHGNYQQLSQPPVQDSTGLKMRCRSIARDIENAHRVVARDNRAGAMLSKKLCVGNFAPAMGRFTVLIPKHTGASSDTEWGSAWVGISEYTFESQLRGGVDLAVEISGKVSYTAWYEGFRYEASYLYNFNVTGGDVIQVNIATTSPTMGHVRLINVSTGNSISVDVTAPPGIFLTGDNAEWIIEDFLAGGCLPLADFGRVVFTNASAKMSTGRVEDLRGATIIKMVLDGKLVADSVINT